MFVPATRSETPPVNDSPLAHALGLLMTLTVGWPGYLLFNITGPRKYAAAAGGRSHFEPLAALFDNRLSGGAARGDKPLWVVASDLGLLGAAALLVAAARRWGALAVLAYYGVPYLVVNAHLVLITFLQHTDVYVPHYRAAQFDWLRGALCTVDRSFGWPLDAAMHHITDTHVAHHLFSDLPFYHATEATAALRRALGAYYLKDETPLLQATWRAWTQCRFVEDEGDTVYYKNAQAHAAGRPAAGGGAAAGKKGKTA